MITEIEILIFVNELKHLLDEYKRCKDDVIKKVIVDDIQIIVEILWNHIRQTMSFCIKINISSNTT